MVFVVIDVCVADMLLGVAMPGVCYSLFCVCYMYVMVISDVY